MKKYKGERKMNHTQDKWKVNKIDNMKDSYSIEDSKGYPLVSIVSGLGNANLIASAPELLRAIKPLVTRITVGDSWAKFYPEIKFAEKVIAKAEEK